jgi:PKD repeat protein
MPVLFTNPVNAAYVENDTYWFVGYKQKIESALQDTEREFRVNNSITDATISNLRNLIAEAYSRLPDSGEAAWKNESLKKSVDLYLDLAAKNKSSQTHVGNAVSQASRFLSDATIEQITGNINANPSSGNAPLVSSFLATAKDPSGINLPDKNYTWWMREAGGYRRELWRGPSLTYTFTKEWNYQVFLDVVSESRNKKGKADVTPLSLSQDIEVKPRLGNIILLINGVNVSNLDTIKISPALGKIGLLFDATASRAVSNGTIVKTKWNFGNGNTLEYDGAPVLERQLFVNPEMYKTTLEITTNQWQSFTKQIQLLVRDPAAVISLDKEIGFVGDTLQMSAKSYLANTTNIEYSWEIQDVETGKKIIESKIWSAFSYKFTKIGKYLVTLTTRSPNGNTDADSRTLIIDSREPVINLDTPRSISTEKPNTILFDASRSYDPDNNTTKDLSYSYSIDGEKVTLNDLQKNGAIGTYTFTEKWTHTVSLTVSNSYGKVSTVDKKFDITSTLTVGMNISPRATPIGSMVSFQARSPQAGFYEWDVGDGSPSINGTIDSIQHVYKKTGIYSATLSVKNSDWSEENKITRKIYITDTDKPYALIDIKTNNWSALEDSTACDNPNGAFIINRADSTTLDAGNSINTDGNSSGLSYTWKYLDRVKTGPSISEKFTELWCFPIELTVRSDKTGASHTSTRFIQIKNIVPKVTSVTASIDPSKKDTQKIIVKVSANGTRDDDGVITSYVWFYKTESDSEKQNIRITQTPTTTYILPNVTEKYYFWVIVEDNDGARYDSSDSSEQSPLLVANDDANINMPLISLTVDKSQILSDETVHFSATAKNILNTDITRKSEYFWDFDGDGRIEQKTTEPQASFTYKKSGKYNMKLKVVNNGASNTKYQLINVKNELKANVLWYQMGDMTYFFNTSRGTYDGAKWNIGNTESTSLYGISIANALLSGSGSLGNLTVKSGSAEISTADITNDLIQKVEKSQSGINVQSYPAIVWDTITISSPTDKVLLSLHGNNGKEYLIDTDTKVDSDLDAIGNNDKDNKDTPSYTDGSVYAITGLSDTKNRTRMVKIGIIGDDGAMLWTKDITLVFDYIKEVNTDTNPIDIKTSSGSEGFSTADKENLEKLQSKIRSLSPEDRIVYTQYYNTLIENWADLNDRTEGLLNIQKEVNNSTTLDAATKTELSGIIDIILVWDAQSTNEISVASHVIGGLIPTGNPNRAYIIERIEQIKAHPGSLTENKALWKEILQKIQDDTSISTENKLIIKSQLLTIVNWGQDSIPDSEKSALAEKSVAGNGILGFISGTVKIFLIVLGIIGLLFLIGYIVYRLSRKSSDMGFQDFLIDSIAHNKSRSPWSVWENMPSKKTEKSIDLVTKIVLPNEPPKTENESPADPLSSIWAYSKAISTDTTTSESSLQNSESASPYATDIAVQTPTETLSSATAENDNHEIPDWLKPVQKDTSIPKTPSTWKKDDSDSIIIKDPVDPLAVEDVSNDVSDPLRINIEGSEQSQDSSVNTAWSDEVLLSPSETLVENEETQGIKDMPLSRDDIDPIIAPTSENTQQEEVDLIPDWLKPINTDAPMVAESAVNTSSPEDEIIAEPPVIIPPSPDADLPDWLKSSMDNSDEPSTLSEPKKTKSAVKEKSTKKQIWIKRKEVSQKPRPTSWEKQDDIPDWLK